MLLLLLASHTVGVFRTSLPTLFETLFVRESVVSSCVIGFPSLCSVFITLCVSLVLVRLGFLLSARAWWFLVRLVDELVVYWESLPC